MSLKFTGSCMPKQIGSVAACAAVAMTAAVAPVGLVHAAKDCLAAPNGAVAQGQHWYYRVDRNTGQKCWYRDTAGHKIRTGVTAQAAHRSEPPAKPRPPSRETADDVVAAVCSRHGEFGQ